jgi:CDP-glucose 4,6-dehydratase
MAAQPLVRRSYTEPLLTFQTNVLGTANLLECVRLSAKTIGALVVTSDKVYRNLETGRAFIEEDELGGVDPYSASKSAAEMVVTAWREMPKLSTDKLIVSARAGNIIGGGDHAEDRLLPDLIRSFRRGLPAKIRSPKSIRPWQHVLDPIWGYCLLVNRILEGKNISNSYNFGPSVNYQYSVEQIAKWACQYWGDGASWIYESPLELLPESKLLSLNSSKANVELGWNPKLDTRRAVEWTVRWEKERTNANVLLAIDKQIQKYLELKS